MYSTYNEVKPVVAEIFIRTLKNKIFKHVTAISKNVYFDLLDDIVNKCNNTVHKTIKMKHIDVTDDSYAECNKDFDKKDPKFKVGDHVTISKFKNIFAKGYAPNWSEKNFVISKIKNTVSWTYVVNNLNSEEITGSFYEKGLKKTSQITGRFYEKGLKKTSQEKFKIEKKLKRKGDKLHVKWKGYDNRFHSCIAKKDLI